MHKFEVPAEFAERILARRGRSHAYETIDPAHTALLVIDMQRTFMDPGAPSEVPVARDIVPNINRLSRALRAAGGLVAFSIATFPRVPGGGWNSFFDHMVSPEIAQAILEGLAPGAPGRALWPALEVEPADVQFDKARYSAFARHGSDIEKALVARDIDTVIVVGTMTNLCCDSTARDAMQLGFKTIMVSDANAARTDAEHQAALLTFKASFGDVRTTEEMVGLIEMGTATATNAEASAAE
ncbi:MAG TPA: isochorismatase family cysteine hydrolase [Alphaproteobacteria bacterium]|nr:isochorismatase family cysteine hydrolase [Alphaproteobacteria bacterium]